MSHSQVRNMENNTSATNLVTMLPDTRVVPQAYKMYKRRWLGMGVIIGLNIATGLVWLTFSSVSSISEKWLHASLSEVNLSSILYFIGSIVTSSFSGFVFEKWGIKIAVRNTQNNSNNFWLQSFFELQLIIGGILNLVGCIIRYLGSFIESSDSSHEARLGVILFGQFVAACAQPFFLNVAAKYSAVWFDDSSRTVATMIGTVCKCFFLNY